MSEGIGLKELKARILLGINSAELAYELNINPFRAALDQEDRFVKVAMIGAVLAPIAIAMTTEEAMVEAVALAIKRGEGDDFCECVNHLIDSFESIKKNGTHTMSFQAVMELTKLSMAADMIRAYQAEHPSHPGETQDGNTAV